MIDRHFDTWGYAAVQELERLCQTLPILPQARAGAFLKEAGRATKDGAKPVDRRSGSLFESMMGFVGASNRKDFSASWDNDNPEALGHGILMVETYDATIGVTFCLARVSEDTFITYGWIGEAKSQSLKSLRSEPYGSTGRKWWQFWK